jgi:hypothetical protein
MAAATRVFKGTITTDGAGAGSASIVSTGYRFKSAHIRNVDAANAGVITIKDNNGAGATLQSVTLSASVQNGGVRPNPYTTVVNPLVVAITGGGASKRFRYEVVLKR